jgi:hypothetical protein
VIRRYRYGLLILPFLFELLPFFYNRSDPALFGLPFFYWYQLAWVLVTGALIGIVVALSRGEFDV